MPITYCRPTVAFIFAATLTGILAGDAHSMTQPTGPEGETARHATKTEHFYVGTYTGAKSKGIYRFALDLETGKLTPEGLVAETANPSFLALHPNGHYLYAVNETDNGAVSAFAIAPKDGHLTFLNQQPAMGSAPCHLSLTAKGDALFVANYGNGTVAVLPVEANGHLEKPSCTIQQQGTGADPQRQAGPHAHEIVPDAANKHILAADLGADKVFVYRYDPHGRLLETNDPPAGVLPPGSGPRHFSFSADGHHLYVINELNSTVCVFRYDAASGALTLEQTLSSLPKDASGNNAPAEILVAPGGKFLYGSNRGQNSLAIFSIAQDTGLLTYVGEQSTLGKNPRHFCIDPSGAYLLAANQDTDNIVVYRIDHETGLLTPTGNEAQAGSPVCLLFTPSSH